MKKILLIFLILSISINLFSQKIKRSEIDKFTKQYVIETSFEKLSFDGFNASKNISVSFIHQENIDVLRVKWITNHVYSISKDNKILFMDNNNNIYNFFNISYVISERGAGSTGLSWSASQGLDFYITGDFDELKEKEITRIRIYTTDGYMDFKISEKYSNKFQSLYKIFEEEKLKINNKIR